MGFPYSAELAAELAERAVYTAKTSLLIGLVLVFVGLWFGGIQLQVHQPWNQVRFHKPSSLPVPVVSNQAPDSALDRGGDSGVCFDRLLVVIDARSQPAAGRSR